MVLPFTPLREEIDKLGCMAFVYALLCFVLCLYNFSIHQMLELLQLISSHVESFQTISHSPTTICL